ncbi:hypothetical protein [Fusibacter sp. 3D3]|uniref:hypothetical protein n=1 Tax=Fusibacter sp. 3D3 TaxID=1048380 RepID=UPI000852ECA7|nr:hypothetical protein [Fusibacter sp. 3D3]GAU78487.1 hypothetical protein F3D3_3121 [Fusibacter sp. 3D3]
MGYKGTLRSLEATMRAAERDSKRRQREFENREKQLQKMQELERAKFEVDQYENDLEVKTSLHKEITGYNWNDIGHIEKPVEPLYLKNREEKARYALDTYKPRFIDKIFKKEEKKIEKMKIELKNAMLYDKNEYDENYETWQKKLEEYENLHAIYLRISSGDRTAFKTWVDLSSPFEEIEALGTSIEIDYMSDSIKVYIDTCPIDIIPQVSKSLLKSGKLSEKSMSASKRNALYQNYVASESIRVARELFEMIPVNEVVINTKMNLLNKSTGYHENCIILSVFYVRETLKKINYELIVPSEALSNFIHNINFNKTTGFDAVDAIEK